MSQTPLPANGATNWRPWASDIHNGQNIADQVTSGTGVASDALKAAYVSRVAAPTGTAATDTARIQAAIDAGGVVVLQAGTYVVTTLQIKTGVTLRGVSVGGTTIKLADSTNADLLTVPNFSTLTGGNTSGGETKWALEHLTLDGNGANQTGTSWAFRVYAYNYRVDDVEIINGLTGNAYSEWGNNAGGDMEAVWTRFKLLSPISDTAIGLDWRGPHDSIFLAGEVVAKSNAISLHQTGIWSRGNGGGEVFQGVHVWGFHQNGWIFEHSADCTGCEAEGSYAANVLLRSNGVRFAGRVFGTSGINATEVGVQVGDGTVGNVKRCVVDIDTFNWSSGAFAVSFGSDGGFNRIRGTGILGTSTAFYTGTRSPNTEFDILGQDGTTDQSQHQHPGPLNIRSSSTSALGINKLTYNATNHILDLRGGGLLRGYKSDDTTQTLRLDHGIGAVVPGTTAGTGSQIFSGSGAPTISATSGDFYFRKDTPGTAGQRLYVCSGGTSWSSVDSAAGTSADVQAFTANGTWTKPSGAVAVSVLCIGAGGGGGSGGRFASGQVSCGGGGGGGGGMSTQMFRASSLPATVSVTVGPAGVGGAAQTTDSTAGITATAATATNFGTYLQAGRGGGGTGGGNGVAGANGGGGGALATGGNGAASSSTGAAPSAPAGSTAAPGGGAGGGITSGVVASAGGAGGVSTLQSGVTAGAGGTVGAGQAGANGATSGADGFGTGAGGGAANTTAAAGAGGNGGTYGAGGAGGGASLNGSASGKGGDGGPGLCLVVTTF